MKRRYPRLKSILYYIKLSSLENYKWNGVNNKDLDFR